MICGTGIVNALFQLKYQPAHKKGAAVQRIQGLNEATEPFIFFIDDDIVPEPDCLMHLWNCMQLHEKIGGVNAMITNQQYHTPGKATAMMYRLMNGKSLPSYAGKCIGPAWNLLPQDAGENVNPVEWLNTTCVLYRRKALPRPLFPEIFQGYSLMEDLALSLTVARDWKLFNVRISKIFHDSQPGAHKKNEFALSKMEMVNRHYIMTKILGRKGFEYHLKLFLFEFWGVIPLFTSVKGLKKLFPVIGGKLAASFSLLFKRN